jgi:hypothetical protein
MMTPEQAEDTLNQATSNPEFLHMLIAAVLAPLPGQKAKIVLADLEEMLGNKGLGIRFNKDHTVELSLLDKPRHGATRDVFVGKGGVA